MKRNWFYLLLFIIVPTLFFSCKKSDSTTPLVGNWTSPSQIKGIARSGAVSFTIGEFVYYGLGYNQLNKPRYLKDFYRYDYSKNQFVKLASLPDTAQGRSDAVAFSVNGKGYIGTGYNGDLENSYLTDFWEYDPATDQWRKVASLPGWTIDANNPGRRNAVAFAIGAEGFVGTGNNGTYLNDFWKYTPNADSGVWTPVADLPFARQNAVSFVIDNKGYVVTGDNNNSYISGAERLYVYDPAQNVWERKRDITNTSTESYDDNYTSIARSNGVAMVMNDGTQTKAYISTGIYNSSPMSTTWEYNPSTDLWTQKTQFEGASRRGAFGFSVGNRIFVACGTNGSSYYSDIWEFKPTEEYDANN